MIWSVSTFERRSGTPTPVCRTNFSIGFSSLTSSGDHAIHDDLVSLGDASHRNAARPVGLMINANCMISAKGWGQTVAGSRAGSRSAGVGGGARAAGRGGTEG